LGKDLIPDPERAFSTYRENCKCVLCNYKALMHRSCVQNASAAVHPLPLRSSSHAGHYTVSKRVGNLNIALPPPTVDLAVTAVCGCYRELTYYYKVLLALDVFDVNETSE